MAEVRRRVVALLTGSAPPSFFGWQNNASDLSPEDRPQGLPKTKARGRAEAS